MQQNNCYIWKNLIVNKQVVRVIFDKRPQGRPTRTVQSYSSGNVHLLACFLGPTWVHNPNGISTGSAVLQGSRSWQADQQTDHATSSVAICRIYTYVLLRWGLTVISKNSTLLITFLLATRETCEYQENYKNLYNLKHKCSLRVHCSQEVTVQYRNSTSLDFVRRIRTKPKLDWKAFKNRRRWKIQGKTRTDSQMRILSRYFPLFSRSL